MTQVLSRLRRMTRDEVSWRAAAAARIAADRIVVRLHRPAWRRDQIRRVLAAGVIDAPLDQAITTGQWDSVHDRLATHLRSRENRFALEPSSLGPIREEILRRWPEAAAAAAARADAILAGRYDLLGYRALAFAKAGGSVGWHSDPVHHARAPLRFWTDVPYLDPAIGDHKIIWELNRHQHWLPLGRALWLTGDPRYGQRIVDELEDWLAANPPLMGINWASMLELGFRSMSWVWGLHFLLGASNPQLPTSAFAEGSGETSPGRSANADRPASAGQSGRKRPDLSGGGPSAQTSWLVDMLVGLDRQLTHVEQNLSTYFSPNTHLTGEALALYVAGVALPELAASARWRETGRRILIAEIDRQILGDGGHAERSTHYHRYTLDFYLMALLTARRDGDAEAERRFRNAAARLAGFARAIADDNGRLPLIGDDDGGMLWPLAGRECPDIRDSLAVAAILLERPDLAPWGVQEETCWIVGLGEVPSPRRPVAPSHGTSRVFPDTGYVVFHDATGAHAVFDVGEHGYMNAGHAHADALSITLSLAGHPLLVDPGTAAYTIDPRLRDRFRATASHNTLTIDNQSQAHPSGPFHWHTRANAALHGWRSHPRIDWAEASHDGYAPVHHRRSVLRTTDSGWLIVDEVRGEGTHTAAAHWHVDPRWTLHADAPGRVRASHGDGDEAWILYDAGDLLLAHGDEASGLGWHAPAYGAIVPAWTARITRTAEAPFSIITWIGSTAAGSAGPPVLERLSSARGNVDEVLAARVTVGERSSVLMVCPGDRASHPRPRCEIRGYHTDGRVLHCVEERGVLKRLDVIDAMHAVTPGGGGIVIGASAPIADLHVSIEDGVLDLQASEPPAHLRLQAAALEGVVSIRLNHRELPPRAMDHSDTVFVSGVDWSIPVRDLLTSTA